MLPFPLFEIQCDVSILSLRYALVTFTMAISDNFSPEHFLKDISYCHLQTVHFLMPVTYLAGCFLSHTVGTHQLRSITDYGHVTIPKICIDFT